MAPAVNHALFVIVNIRMNSEVGIETRSTICAHECCWYSRVYRPGGRLRRRIIIIATECLQKGFGGNSTLRGFRLRVDDILYANDIYNIYIY